MLLKSVYIDIVPEGLTSSEQLGKSFSVAEINARQFYITYPPEYATGYTFTAKVRQGSKVFHTQVIDDMFRVNLTGFDKGKVELQMEWYDEAGDITYQDNTILKFALSDSIELTYSSLLGKPVDVILYEHIQDEEIHEPFPDTENNENKVLSVDSEGEILWVDPASLGGSHTHDNKPLLDSLTDGGDGLTFLSDDGTYKTVPNQSVGHVHVNLGALDKITDGGAGTQYLTDDGTYKAISTSAHTHSNKDTLDLLYRSGLGDHVLSDAGTYIPLTDISDGHSHVNKALLDSLTDSGLGNDYLADDGTYKPITNISDGHTHSNKDTLDLLYRSGLGNHVLSDNGTYIPLTDISDGHNHLNKPTLDVITDAGDGTNYLSDDGVYKPITNISDGHTHSNKGTLDAIKNDGTQGEYLSGDGSYVNTSSISDGHSHTNKSTLDNVTNSGDGSQFLSDDGTYKTVSGSGGIGEAPLDGTPYSRQDAGWVSALTDAPSDGSLYARQDGTWTTFSVGGDMTKAVYDPTGVNGDTFDMDNMLEGTTNKILTATEKSKLVTVENGAEVNNISDANATTLTTSVNADALHTHAQVTDSNSTTGLGQLKMWTGTQAEYDAIGTKDTSTVYFIK